MSTDTPAAGGRGALRAAAGCLVAAVLLAGAAALLGGPSAWADTEEGTITWSVVPADASGPDGRSTIAHELAPGEQVRDRIAVRNLSDTEVTFDLAAADGFYTAEGHFDMLAAGQPSTEAGTWIDLPTTVTLDPGQTQVVPFTLSVPEQTEPGDHAAGVAASVQAGGARSPDGTEMALRSRVGIQVMTRVTGDLTAVADLSGVDLDYQGSAHPLRPGTARATFVVQNTGNTQLTATGTVRLGGRDVPFPAEGHRPQTLLPGERRTISVPVPQVWPTGRITADIVLTPQGRTIEGESVPVAQTSTRVSAWAIPVPQLVTLAGVTLLTAALVGRRRRARRRLAALLAQAREAGRREAITSQGPS